MAVERSLRFWVCVIGVAAAGLVLGVAIKTLKEG